MQRHCGFRERLNLEMVSRRSLGLRTKEEELWKTASRTSEGRLVEDGLGEKQG